MAEQKKSGMSGGTWAILIGTALLFDVIKWLLLLLPVVGEILGMLVGAFAWATFELVFKMHNEKFSRNTLVVGFIIDLIPVVGEILPEWTFAIVKLYFDSKAKKVLAKTPVAGKVVQMESKVENKKAA